MDFFRAFSVPNSPGPDELSRIKARMAFQTNDMRAQYLTTMDWRTWFGSMKRAMDGKFRMQYQPNGNRECTRRRNQIEAYQLRVQNGLQTAA